MVWNVDSKEQPYQLSPPRGHRPQRVIQFDVDGVLADFNASFTLEGHLLFGTKVFGDAEQVDWYYQDEGSMNDAQRDKVWDIVKNTPLWWYRLRPLVNQRTFDRIAQLHLKHEVVFVTNRISNCEPPSWQTKMWLEKHGIGRPSVIVTKKKGQAAEAIGADYSIEDKIENCWAIHWISDRPQTRSYLVNRPYNQLGGRRIGPRVPRVDTVDEFLDIIEKESR